MREGHTIKKEKRGQILSFLLVTRLEARSGIAA